MGDEGNKWKWMSRLFTWEEEHVLECCSLLIILFFQGNIVDTSTRIYNPAEGYSVKGVYQLLTHDDQQSKEPFTNRIWKKFRFSCCDC